MSKFVIVRGPTRYDWMLTEEANLEALCRNDEIQGQTSGTVLCEFEAEDLQAAMLHPLWRNDVKWALDDEDIERLIGLPFPTPKDLLVSILASGWTGEALAKEIPELVPILLSHFAPEIARERRRVLGVDDVNSVNS